MKQQRIVQVKAKKEFLPQTDFLTPISMQCRRPQIFQTMTSVRSKNLNLKFPRFKPSGCKDIGIRKFEFVAKTKFLNGEMS